MECNKINGGDSFRDASFSYLRSDHEQQSLSNPRISTATRTSFGLERPKKSTDPEAEISVFGAERYFNTPISASENDPTTRRLYLHRRSADDLLHRPGTPCSESSWTSRSTALLLKSSSAKADAVLATSAPRKSASYGCYRTGRRLVRGSRSFFATLGCTGTCSGDKSVFVANGDQRAVVVVDTNNQLSQETNDRLRYEARSTKRPEEHFAFPILSTAAANSTDENSKNTDVVVVDSTDEAPRMSLEVFGSKTTSKTGNDVIDEVAMNLERKLSVLTWDAIPSAKPYKTLSPKSATSVGRHDDLDSDASSDLFEIENMVVTSAAVARRGSGPPEEEEECGAIAMSSPPCGYHYEPSEASIEWSVVTASCGGGAGDPGSDYDEKKLSANRKPPTQHKARRSGGGGILGCKSQKSVRVAENAHTTS